jgi:hypothetical protein
MVTLHFILVPLVVVLVTLKYMPPGEKEKSWSARTIHTGPFLLLALLWTSQMDEQLFLNLRDKLLLSNSLGTKVTDFYYDYTCYPTNIFETLNQRLIKTCDLDTIKNTSMLDIIESVLLNHDYLNIGNAGITDLKITKQETILFFESKEKIILQTTLKDFLSKPGTVLREFSSKTDNHSFFRQFTFISLLFVFPVILYILLYSFFRLIFALFIGQKAAYVTASILCFITGTSLLVIFLFFEGKVMGEEDLEYALQSENLVDRITALKIIEHKGLEIADYDYRRILNSPYVTERYWLVNTLRVSRRPETLEDLMIFLDDPHSNVISRALYALGQRREERVIHEILERMKISTDWRNQRYAYIALRNLGWKQSKSI